MWLEVAVAAAAFVGVSRMFAADFYDILICKMTAVWYGRDTASPPQPPNPSPLEDEGKLDANDRAPPPRPPARSHSSLASDTITGGSGCVGGCMGL